MAHVRHSRRFETPLLHHNDRNDDVADDDHNDDHNTNDDDDDHVYGHVAAIGCRTTFNTMTSGKDADAVRMCAQSRLTIESRSSSS